MTARDLVSQIIAVVGSRRWPPSNERALSWSRPAPWSWLLRAWRSCCS